MTTHPAIQLAFLLSGVAGLTHEVLWSRYLGLFVGHSAYAQVLVLAVYLGGMAIGSLAIADRSRRLRSPLRWYAGIEAVLALFGVAFHWMYLGVTDLSYEVLFPALGSASLVGSVRWALAGLLILPQAILLGATFPLMAAGLVRDDESRPGRGVATAYLYNTLGGAAGVLLTGFVFIGAFGLPGTSVVAATLNLMAAGLVWSRLRGAEPSEDAVSRVEGSDAASAPAPAAPEDRTGEEELEWHRGVRSLTTVLMPVALGTAVASFAYEIGWIRMLALLLGSATHSFELMLSAFILGIALGAWVVRRRSDASPDPVRFLGVVQVMMGVTALLSLPVYLASFDLMAGLVQAFGSRPGGYHVLNLGRYGLSLLVMLPSTVLAGMTLPLITGSLIRAGAQERTIGYVYGVNTIGSVLGAGAAGLILLPLLGLEGLITAGAALDIGLGLWLVERSGRWTHRGVRLPALAAAASALVIVGVTAAVDLNPTMLSSGVYRFGEVANEDQRESLFYEDGRTATVSAHMGLSDGLIVLSTNGKPEASLEPRWVVPGRDTLPPTPIGAGRDFTTQVLGPAAALAHRPQARSIANIGHGSGMTGASFLTSSVLERLVTIEIEPLMVEGSLVFLPANATAFADPRTSYVFDDAKSYFAYQQERFDVVFAEPSNPWVSGTASLFTREFYERVTDFVAEDGVFVQWIQLYELNDELFLSVLAALDAVFPSYRAYLVGDADVVIVASLDDVGDPDWSVVHSEAFEALTASAPPFLAQHMEALFLFDQGTFRRVLDGAVTVNSDFRPVLDLGAERARFEQSAAQGMYTFATSRVSLQHYIAGLPQTLHEYAVPPSYGLSAAVRTERGAWLRGAVQAGGGLAPEEFPGWDADLRHLQTFFVPHEGPPPAGWQIWAAGFVSAENALHWGTSGWSDSTFYGRVYDFMDRQQAPDTARAVVDLMHGYAEGDWVRSAAAADLLLAPVSAGRLWVPPDLLIDVAVLAYLETGQPRQAEAVLDLLERDDGLPTWNLRSQLLRAMARDALGGG